MTLRLLLAAALLPCGCASFSVLKVREGNPIDGAQVAEIRRGTSTLQDVLGALGAPLEMHAHPDGKVLIYRYRAQNTSEMAISADNVVAALELTGTVSRLLENLSFQWERVHADEDRVVVVIDRDQRVQGIAYREATKDLPIL